MGELGRAKTFQQLKTVGSSHAHWVTSLQVARENERARTRATGQKHQGYYLLVTITLLILWLGSIRKAQGCLALGKCWIPDFHCAFITKDVSYTQEDYPRYVHKGSGKKVIIKLAAMGNEIRIPVRIPQGLPKGVSGRFPSAIHPPFWKVPALDSKRSSCPKANLLLPKSQRSPLQTLPGELPKRALDVQLP